MPEMKLVNADDLRLLGMDETASLLGLKKSTIYAMCMRRQIPCVKIGRLNRFRLVDLNRWIESHLQESRNTNEFNV